ncbi:MAG: hypothetical protein U9O83_03470 [Campylobacterota bacterium]|nr:hypothetical protein [Campylobacterota bacterium]
MYKNILLALIIAIFAGCSAPKPKLQPSWYTNPPKDYKNFYAVATANNDAVAKNLATLSLRESINADLDSSFKVPNHKLAPEPKMLQKIISSNAKLCKKLSLRGVKVEKSQIFNGQTLILISISREELFKKLQLISGVKFQNLKEQYNKNKNDIAIRRYTQIKPLMAQYASLASATGCKQISVSTYNSNNDFRVLKELHDEFKKLKSSINFYILSDGNSRIYTKGVIEAIKKAGLSISRKVKDSSTFKLLITSKTTDSKEYSFNMSKNLVKFTTFDANENKIAFRQHTFIGKSRKNHKEAKYQAAIYLNKKIDKLGIFDFIGIQKK